MGHKLLKYRQYFYPYIKCLCLNQEIHAASSDDQLVNGRLM